LFGRRITRHYQGKLQTVLDQREAGHPVLRWYYQSSFAKQYTRGDRHADRILRTETCSNDTRHFGIGRRVENLPLLRDKLLATNKRCLALQAELLASTVDTGQLSALAQPTIIGQRRIPGLKIHDDRVIRLLEALLHPAAFAPDWTTRELHSRVLGRHQLGDGDYRLSQLRYDLVKLRTRLLGPLTTLVIQSTTSHASTHPDSVNAAFHHVDAALDHLSATLGFKHAA
jgi:hypothetical protein